jgi:nitrite reductase/ring-hydroxylating ferredoxin subunit
MTLTGGEGNSDAQRRPGGALTRRGLLAGAAAVGVTAVGAGVLAGCGGAGSARPSSTEPVTLPADQVPVGGAVIAGAVVVSQPTSGQFRAFSAVCTHQGCLVSRVQEATVECTCHGSTFSALDGAVLVGPAVRPLNSRTVTADGDTLTIT